MAHKKHKGDATKYVSVGLPSEIVDFAALVAELNGDSKVASVLRQCIHEALFRLLEEVCMQSNSSIPGELVDAAERFRERVGAILAVPPEVKLSELTEEEREKMLGQIAKLRS